MMAGSGATEALQGPLEQSSIALEGGPAPCEEREGLAASAADGQGREKTLLVTGVGLAGSLYSVTAVSLIGPCLSEANGGLSGGRVPSLIVAVLFGLMLGSISFGSLSDCFGRGRRMLCSLAALSFVSFLGAACAGSIFGNHGSDALCTELTVWLFLLGLAAGGEYPVAGAYVVETFSGQAAGSAAPRALASAYLCLVLGQLLAPLSLLLLLSLHLRLEVVWRLSFLLGAFLSFLSFVARWCWARETVLFRRQRASRERGRQGCCSNGLALVLESSKALTRTLLGTCSAAFLYSALAGGLFLHTSASLLLPVASAADAQAPTQLASISLLTALLSFPGYLAAYSFAWQGRRRWQLVGFGAVAVCLLGLAAATYADVRSSISRILYALILTLAAGGPGATAHFVPAEVFPTCVRATSLGVSMAAGCLGWAAAFYGLQPLLDGAGLSVFALVLATASALGAMSSLFLTPAYDRQTLQATIQLGPVKDLRESTISALEQVSQFRSCPSCDVMVERAGGCNVITCTNCQDVWCFVCRGRSCRAWACTSVDDGALSLEALPRILWPASPVSTPSNSLASSASRELSIEPRP